MTIGEANYGAYWHKVKTRMFLLDSLSYRGSNQIMICTGCNLIKGSFE